MSTAEELRKELPEGEINDDEAAAAAGGWGVSPATRGENGQITGTPWAVPVPDGEFEPLPPAP